MSTVGNFFLNQEYAAIAARGDPLNEINGLIDWELFRPPVIHWGYPKTLIHASNHRT